MAMEETNRTEYRAQKQPPTDVGLSYVNMSSVSTDQCGGEGESQTDFSINAAEAVSSREHQEV